MKILYYSPHPNLNLGSPSGPGTHMREVINAFEKEGHQVIRLIMGGETTTVGRGIVFDKPWYKQIIKYFVPGIIWQSLKDFRLLQFDKEAERQLDKIVREEKPDLIYERGYYLMSSGLRVAQYRSIPHFIEINAPYPEERITFEGKSVFIKRSCKVEHLQVSRADRVIVVSTALKDYLEKRYPRTKGKYIVTPNAINPVAAKFSVSEVQNLKSKFGFSDQHLVIGFVGSIFRYHGVDRLLSAFSRLINEFHMDNIRLLIVGDGLVLPELRQFAQQQNIHSKVQFVGNVPHGEVYNYIALMDVAIMASSNWYGSPVKVFEYGALKKAIIAPDNIPLRDVMTHDVDGILVGDSENEVVQALQKLLNDSLLRTKLSEAFHQKVMSQYTWKHVANAILSQTRDLFTEKSAATRLIPLWSKRILVLRTDFAHHGKDAGYKQLLRYISPTFVLGITEGEEDLVSRSRLRYQWMYEFNIRKFISQVDLVHIMYAEDYLRFSPFMYPGTPVVATFHQPPETLEIEISTGKTRGKVGRYTHLLSKSRFRKLAAAIVTEENQKTVLSRVMPPEKIHIIPLGVHLSKFHDEYKALMASGLSQQPNQIITVGNWLRDWNFYFEVLRFCETNRPGYQFHLVNRKLEGETEQKLSGFRNINIHRDISDSELKQLLFTSRLHFLPVLSASGNNALIEGLAMGCPALMTDVVSENFPLRSESVLLYERGNLESAIKQIDSVLGKNTQEYMTLKESTFARSIPYDWKEIALRTMKVYQTVTK